MCKRMSKRISIFLLVLVLSITGCGAPKSKTPIEPITTEDISAAIELVNDAIADHGTFTFGDDEYYIDFGSAYFENYEGDELTAYIETYEAAATERGSHIGDLYLDVIDLYTKLAKQKGVDNYIAYAQDNYCYNF